MYIGSVYILTHYIYTYIYSEKMFCWISPVLIWLSCYWRLWYIYIYICRGVYKQRRKGMNKLWRSQLLKEKNEPLSFTRNEIKFYSTKQRRRNQTPNYTVQPLFRLNFQRLISGAFPQTDSFPYSVEVPLELTNIIQNEWRRI